MSMSTGAYFFPFFSSRASCSALVARPPRARTPTAPTVQVVIFETKFALFEPLQVTSGPPSAQFKTEERSIFMSRLIGAFD